MCALDECIASSASTTIIIYLQFKRCPSSHQFVGGTSDCVCVLVHKDSPPNVILCKLPSLNDWRWLGPFDSLSCFYFSSLFFPSPAYLLFSFIIFTFILSLLAQRIDRFVVQCWGSWLVCAWWVALQLKHVLCYSVRAI